MFNPNKQPKTDPPQEVIAKRFIKKLESESSLDFLAKVFSDLPELEMYLVGGIVRDTLIEHPTSKDYDFIARNVPIEKLIKTLKKYGSVNLVGQNFGVLKFVPWDSTLEEPIDIALPRQDFSDNTGGYRDFQAQSDDNLPVEDDLSRRDLTINAIAYQLQTNQIIDPFNGQQDLKDGIVRSVGKPEDRFQEDYSRMLRAIRFAGRFNFTIENKTYASIKKLMPHINDERETTIVRSIERKLIMATSPTEKKKLQTKLDKQKAKNPNETMMERVVPMETIAKELLKSFSENPTRALQLWDDSGAFEQILPEVLTMKNCEQPPEFHAEGDVWQHTKLMIEKINSPEFKAQFPNAKISGEFALSVLLHDIGKPPTKKTPEHDGSDRIRFNGHNTEGAKIARGIGNRLKLSTEQLAMLDFLITEHMFLMSTNDISVISNNKIAKRFIDNPNSPELLMLFYLDSLCSLRPDGTSPMKNFQETLKKIEEIKTIRANQPISIINGKEIIDLLESKSGALIGIVKQIISELSDKGEINNIDDAIEFVKKHKKLLLEYSDKIDKNSKDKAIEEIMKQI